MSLRRRRYIPKPRVASAASYPGAAVPQPQGCERSELPWGRGTAQIEIIKEDSECLYAVGVTSQSPGLRAQRATLGPRYRSPRVASAASYPGAAVPLKLKSSRRIRNVSTPLALHPKAQGCERSELPW